MGCPRGGATGELLCSFEMSIKVADILEHTPLLLVKRDANTSIMGLNSRASITPADYSFLTANTIQSCYWRSRCGRISRHACSARFCPIKLHSVSHSEGVRYPTSTHSFFCRPPHSLAVDLLDNTSPADTTTVTSNINTLSSLPTRISRGTAGASLVSGPSPSSESTAQCLGRPELEKDIRIRPLKGIFKPLRKEKKVLPL
ncbi:hypothetical protein EJ05DRAFT_157987 [Pseudovirgaria hyperparasitica]|uniref:Uncharacterized protein n=1 Tax=Pseudovirgaria hyperparasitica TaxID=470096 RepID=A0A6A6VX99_9PEZI|nr:uncharacterized protein EJ05DRAFT_157987 [Pseudovirgaria hyperparasitica]KAF2753887.1 hypothetical protein EJ05DRAFT_157987 [Pseudovirgaria hyperparasitica]